MENNLSKTTIFLNNLRTDLQDELTAIKGYDTHADMAENLGFLDAARILRDIRDEEKVHVGEILEVMKKYDENFSKSILEGRGEAEEILQKVEEEPIFESKIPKDIEDREYALPEEKKFPLFDKSHVLAAIKFFNYVDSKNEEKLASKIKGKMKKYGLTSENVGEENRLKKYL